MGTRVRRGGEFEREGVREREMERHWERESKKGARESRIFREDDSSCQGETLVCSRSSERPALPYGKAPPMHLICLPVCVYGGKSVDGKTLSVDSDPR